MQASPCEHDIVSIIIPAYNAEATIRTAIESALRQTCGTLEVIVVDDGSTDATQTVTAKLAQEDSRVRLVAHDGNKGRLEARRTGIQAARGEFCLFVDADDTIDTRTIETCFTQRNASGRAYDIVQFGFDIRYTQPGFDDDRAFTEHYCQPPSDTCFGADITHLIFRQRRAPWSMCGKLFRASILKRAIEYIPAQSLTLAEDACICFIATYFAQSYKGLPEFRGYRYNIDIGGSKAIERTLDLGHFEQLCNYAGAMGCIRAFLTAMPDEHAYREDFETVRREHLDGNVIKLFEGMRAADRPRCFQMLCEHWGAADVVARLAQRCWDKPHECLKSVDPRISTSTTAQASKRIGLYHYRLHTGGAEMVTTKLANLWTAMGYEVVLFTDEPTDDGDYPLPAGLERVVLPDFRETTRENYLARAKALASAVEAHRIDTMVYCQWISPILPWDMLLLKSLGVRFLVHTHSTFLSIYAEDHYLETVLCAAYQYADGIITLNRTDREYWSAINPNTWMVQNPLTLAPDRDGRATLEDHRIVWVGRLSLHDKKPTEALRVLAYVRQVVPDATLQFVGADNDPVSAKTIRDMVAELGLEDCVEFVGEVVDVAPYLRNASVYLLTSKYEGYCLTLAESKAAGVPCVMYELPYLSLVEGERGIRAVPQGDAKAAAWAICDLFANKERLQAAGDAAFSHAHELCAYDYKGAWRKIFAAPAGAGAGAHEDVGTWTPTDVFAHAMDLAHTKQAEEINWLHGEIERLQRERDEAVHNAEQKAAEAGELASSTSYKVGKAIMAIPCTLKDKLRGLRG